MLQPPQASLNHGGDDTVPEKIYIVKYDHDNGDDPFYKTYEQHVNGNVGTTYWNQDLLMELVDNGILKHTENYDLDFIENQD
jgi:hypothetical protein